MMWQRKCATVKPSVWSRLELADGRLRVRSEALRETVERFIKQQEIRRLPDPPT